MKEYIVTEHPDFPYEEPKPQELIRCKDCKHHTQTERNGFVYWSQCNHPHWDLSQGCQLAEVDDTDFCSWAERKEE